MDQGFGNLPCECTKTIQRAMLIGLPLSVWGLSQIHDAVDLCCWTSFSIEVLYNVVWIHLIESQEVLS